VEGLRLVEVRQSFDAPAVADVSRAVREEVRKLPRNEREDVIVAEAGGDLPLLRSSVDPFETPRTPTDKWSTFIRCSVARGTATYLNHRRQKTLSSPGMTNNDRSQVE
jgi:hypothetical protein